MHDRRDFLRRSGGLAVGAWLAAHATACREAAEEAAEARRTGAPPTVLTTDEVRTLEAVADRILPPDGDEPGAAAMGAVVFMDRLLAREPGMLEGVRGGVGVLDAGGSGRDGDPQAADATEAAGFASLEPDARDDALRRLESDQPGLFGLLRMLVLAGVFTDPRHGGNRDGAGWAMIDLEPRRSWQPPFGAYDAPVRREGAAGEGAATRGGDR